MELYPLHTGNFKLDGGAMFGVVPKTLWSRTNPPDANNLCTWAMRSLLIRDGQRLILIDTGIGNKQSDKFFSHYHLHGDDSLDGNLRKLGLQRSDITDVFLTHLHFDHVGGAIEWDARSESYRPAFPGARYWSNRRHWQWATRPNPREKASFLKENILPIEESGQLQFVEVPADRDGRVATPLGFEVELVSGHTDAQMLPVLSFRGRTVVFMADLLPSVGHIPLPYVMGYDTRPLITLSEKEAFLRRAAGEDYLLFLEHDAQNELCTVQHTEKGVRLRDTHRLADLF